VAFFVPIAATGVGFQRICHSKEEVGIVMPAGQPRLIDIERDDSHATHVGRAPDGRQFFITYPFVPERNGERRREFVARYLWAADGSFLDATIKEIPTSSSWETLQDEMAKLMLNLGNVHLGRIRVAPFSVHHSGHEFGLVVRRTEGSAKNDWAVHARPGYYMCFFAPWDGGGYDT
jgi:hypothetical protein